MNSRRFSSYHRLNIVGWEEKWTHIVAQFVTYPKGRRPSSTKPAQQQTRPTLTRDSTSATLLNEGFNNEADALKPNQLGLENMNFTNALEFTRSSSSASLQSASTADSEDDDQTVFSPSSERARSTAATSVTSSSSSPHHDAKLLLTAAADKLARSIDAAEATTASSEAKAPINPLPPLPEGAILHCLHVSSYCFKQGRITIPPRVALTASGFGDPKRWARLQEIRNSKSERALEAASTPPVQHTPPANAFSFHEEGTVPEPSRSAAEKRAGAEKVPKRGRRGGLREILEGGWKRYEKEGLWNLEEYEERRRAGVEKFAPLRHSLLALS